MSNTDSIMEEIADRIRSRRKELGLSYQDLADRTGMNKSSLQRYENGAIANVPLHRLESIAKALCVSPEWLMGWDGLQNEIAAYINSPGEWLYRRKTREGVITLPIGYYEFESLLKRMGYRIVLDDDGQHWIETPEKRTALTDAELLGLARTSIAAVGGIAQSLLDKK